MAAVCTIVNSRPLVPVSSDPENPSVLSPSLLLTQNPSSFTGLSVLIGFGTKDAVKSQWKLVHYLADEFWNRWRSEYLHNLQSRSKCKCSGGTFKEGDVVLVKEKDSHRNCWPIGIVDETYPNEDSKIRKVKVSVIREGTRTSYERPISELIRRDL